jgi:uncharacterized protein Smg (DUF494 family)
MKNFKYIVVVFMLFNICGCDNVLDVMIQRIANLKKKLILD